MSDSAMSNNPYADAMRRWFFIILYSLGAIACAGLVALSLVSGKTVAPGGRGIALDSSTYELAHAPSQFWFAVVRYAILASAFAWLAWRAWRQ